MHHRLASSREMLRLVGEHHTRERRGCCTCKRRSVACHVPRAADYRLLLFKTREIRLMCAERRCLPMQTAIH